MKKIIFYPLLCTYLLIIGNVNAQEKFNNSGALSSTVIRNPSPDNRVAPFILTLPTSTRALGLGGVYVYSSPDADAIFSAPSVISSSRGSSLSAHNYGDEGKYVSLSTTFNISGGVLAFGVQTLTYSVGEKTHTSVPYRPEELFSSLPFASSDIVTSIGYGKSIQGIQFGIVGKMIESRTSHQSFNTKVFDFGFAKTGFGTTWSLTVQNMGPELFDNGGFPLPHQVNFSASTRRRQLGPLDYYGTGRISRLEDGAVVQAGGLEISYWPIRGRTFTGRIGVRDVPVGRASLVTYGAAFTNDNITFEYAFEDFEYYGSVHRFGIRWR